MTEEFNKWWDEDVLVEDNPFNGGTPAYWAWEGWCAAVKAEREACAKVCDHMAARCNDIRAAALESAAENIRARGNT
jgi:hypothetical protein